MMLLQKGHGLQHPNWHVDEPAAAGFSRVYFIEDGETFYKDEKSCRLLACNTLYIFPATVPYRMYCNPDKPLRCLWFHIDFFPVQISSLTAISLDDDLIVKDCISLLQKMFLSDLSQNESCHKVIEGFGVYLTENYFPHQQAMSAVITYMRKHYKNKDLNINSLSERFGYTPEHFIRTFSKTLGISPYQYLLSMRMYEARRLLVTHSVKDTAASVGYDDPKSFSHAFQKKYCISPSVYRRSMLPVN